jgi:hypothetical protein
MGIPLAVDEPDNPALQIIAFLIAPVFGLIPVFIYGAWLGNQLRMFRRLAMTHVYPEVMRRFAQRKYLSKHHHLAYCFNRGWPYLELDSPLVLARFNAAIRQAVFHNHPSARVYFRGQDKHFDSMRPSLFRSPNDSYPTRSLLAAQRDFSATLAKTSAAKRFQRSNLPALLQHYGVRTSWLDVVDNLYVAAWFATHSRKGNAWISKRSGDCGWLYFISTEGPTSCLTVVDFRDKHHHLSTRPHSQHGVSVTRFGNHWSNTALGFEEFVVATVRLRCGPEWRLRGFMASEQFLFPNASDDNTLKLLQKPRASELLRRIEKTHGFNVGTLGNL